MSSKKQAKGVIYILTNPAMPDWVKIGYTDDLDRRLKQLNGSEATPYSFRAYAKYEVADRLSDIVLHSLIDTINPDLRSRETVNGRERKREFFALSKEDAYTILEAIAKISGTKDRLHKLRPSGEEMEDEDEARADRARAKRRNFRFSMVGLAPGDVIVFRDDPSITAVVYDDKLIRLDDEVTSLSGAAQLLKGRDALQGPKFWMYEGVDLDSLRKAREEDE